MCCQKSCRLTRTQTCVVSLVQVTPVVESNSCLTPLSNVFFGFFSLFCVYTVKRSLEFLAFVTADLSVTSFTVSRCGQISNNARSYTLRSTHRIRSAEYPLCKLMSTWLGILAMVIILLGNVLIDG